MSLTSLNPAPAADLSPTGDPWLLTPGPLTTSATVKQAMLHDYGSRDHHFIAVNKAIRDSLVEIIHGEGAFVTVPLQGSGTFAVEAMVASFVPRDGKLLVLANGAYGQRIARICAYNGRAHEVLEWAENQPVEAAAVEARLAADPAIGHVAVIHCETTTGILNPVAEIAAVVERHGRRLLVDAMSAFGAIELDSRKVRFDAVAASSNKCLEGTPGMGFIIARRDALEAAKGNSPSLVLDLHDQWVQMEKTQQWRFTPPVQVIAAFHQAIEEFRAEGGVAGRHARYAANCRTLIDGMRAMGFTPLLPEALQAPIIVTFLMPADPAFHFQTFYDRLRERGFVIYPGKLTVAETFRIGCIGRIGQTEMRAALEAIRATLAEMNIRDCAPRAA